MREIKFRAWDGKRNEMVYFDLNSYNDESRRWYDEQIHNNNIMQYTGLKDKKCVEIYEGDVIDLGHSIGQVVYNTNDFDNPCFCIKVLSEEELYEPFFYVEDTPKLWFEVIGNIYENKLGLIKKDIL